MAQYFGLTITDLYIISYTGQIIQNQVSSTLLPCYNTLNTLNAVPQSVRVRDFLFETPWYRFGAPIRRSMLIILMASIRPQIIMGGKFFVMGYDKLIAVSSLCNSRYLVIHVFVFFRSLNCRFHTLLFLIILEPNK